MHATTSLFATTRDRACRPATRAPQPTSAWPPENVALLERYRDWLLSGGASPEDDLHIYIPMAGHALGLNLKPHPAARPRRRPGAGAGLRQGQALERRVDRHVPRGAGQVPPLPAPQRGQLERNGNSLPAGPATTRPACPTGWSSSWSATSTSCSATGARPAWTSRSAASGAATLGCGAGCVEHYPMHELGRRQAPAPPRLRGPPPGGGLRRRQHQPATCATSTPSCSSCKTRSPACPRPCCACPASSSPTACPGS